MATVSIRDWTKSGEPGADLDRLFGPLYRRLIDGEPADAQLRRLCELLVEDLSAVLVVVSRKLEGGVVVMEAAAPANGLWAELQNLPEHWDGTVAGCGPAALAIESGEPAWISTSEEGFRPWRQAAARERAAAAGAWPLQHDGQTYLIEVFAGDQAFFHNGAVRRRMDRIVRELRRFLEDSQRWLDHQLLAEALQQCGHAAFITSLDGEIVWSNRSFTRLYGYRPDETRGNTPRMLHSGKQGLRYYRDLWSTIRGGRVWSGKTVDRDRDGHDHTVRQTVTPFGSGERITHYLSMHEDVSQQASERERRELRSGTDPGTGLLNFASFAAAIEAEIASEKAFWLVLVSLRGYNESLAGVPGDLSEAVGAELGGRLREALGSDGEAATLRPGEYLLLVRDSGALDPAIGRVTDALGKPFPMLGQPLAVRLRVGHARHPEDGRNFDALRRHADAQLADQPLARARRERNPM